MTIKKEIVALVEELIEKEGANSAKKSIASLLQDAEKPVLTVIANFGNHKIPQRYLQGEVFIASEGNLNFSSEKMILQQYRRILEELRKKLLSRTWSEIYLIPTGHVTLSLQIKMLIYRVTRMNSIDVFYSDGTFFEIDLDIRGGLNVAEDSGNREVDADSE